MELDHAITEPSPAELPATDAVPQAEESPHLPVGWADTGVEIARATRSWIQYGTVGFAVLCIIIGAVESLFGR